MSWTAYQVILRLHSPMHIGGYAQIGYLRRTRPYVTGRVLRGALVSRVGRNNPGLHSQDPRDPYRRVSKTFAQYLTFTYFYPALKNGDDYQVQFHWENEAGFRHRFLSSYTATALDYPQQTAAEGLLHEIEFISPRTLDEGKKVYLMGYIFVNEERLKREKYDWPGAFRRLQLGGERGYGWGDVRLESIVPVDNGQRLFDQEITFTLDTHRPRLTLARGQRLLAHSPAPNPILHGKVEPVVGREWRADNKKDPHRRHIGQHLAFNNLYFVPGSHLHENTEFAIGEGGYWQPLPPSEGHSP